ncbi:YcxB family protein [Paramaledivibacter caminithermalis]|uniref:YcxB-like C-terminal domain-containing protein n=1 Tax=Paramaledivibacter caminithermalis (strain DSM 15212 / CIP 107654 / DViRD3) TaxID=1121301 RepID=A0A1M6LMR7_PARC5|nr:YcxB family protein [Paramaledivibacter caminithermalis]SHJ72445.1 hypothetical protein SAMN02745912_00849 [Paramaledivibacter caminithermalis DSM 15212]
MENNILFNFEYTLNSNEYSNLIFERTKPIQVICSIQLIHMFIFFRYYLKTPNEYLTNTTDIKWYMLFFIGFIVFYIFNKIEARLIIKKNPQLFEKTNLQITEDSVVISQKSIKRIIPRSYIRRIKKLRRIVLIYYSPSQIAVIPRRVISDENLKLITDRFKTPKGNIVRKIIKILCLSTFIGINIAAFYLYKEQTTLRYVLFDENTIIERAANSDEEFHYPYLLYIPPYCDSETYLIVRPNAACREKYYHSDDLEDAKIMLKRWVAESSKYGVNCPVLVPVFPRPVEPENTGFYEGDEEELDAYYFVRNEEYFDRQANEDFTTQLFKMTVDAKKYLLTKDINTVKNRMIVFGWYSLSYNRSISKFFREKYEDETVGIFSDEPLEYIYTALGVASKFY